ncbi:MAG: hypothetical protein QOK19_2271 [Solirubrobacteraceae bacterium]|jgi:hypothetical protein|nr:hypothetical protein [Solirubrobacteraceae bacterium]
MRRIIQTTIASSLLALALPAAALAQHSSHHARGHHHRHHSRAHTVVFTHGVAKTIPGTTTPVTTTPTPPAGEPAGTIASFEGGILKITLADNSTVSGKVTERTEIRCNSASGDDVGDDNGIDGDDNSGDDGDSHGGPSSGHGDLSSHGDDEHHGTVSGEIGEGTCGVSALTPGAKVAEAELFVSSAGSVWEKVEVIQ